MGGYERGRLMNKLADLIEKNREELARLEGNCYHKLICIYASHIIPQEKFVDSISLIPAILQMTCNNYNSLTIPLGNILRLITRYADLVTF